MPIQIAYAPALHPSRRRSQLRASYTTKESVAEYPESTYATGSCWIDGHCFIFCFGRCLPGALHFWGDRNGSWVSKMNQTAGVSHQVKCQSSVSSKAMAKVWTLYLQGQAYVKLVWNVIVAVLSLRYYAWVITQNSKKFHVITSMSKCNFFLWWKDLRKETRTLWSGLNDRSCWCVAINLT